MLSKAASGFFLLLCFLLPQRQTRAQGAAKTESVVNQIRHMKIAVVQIGYRTDAPAAAQQAGHFEPPRVERAGTGFFVSKSGYVLTAGHVIRETENSARQRGATTVLFKIGILLDSSSVQGVSFRGSFFWVDASPVEVDEVHDVALLKVSRNPFTGEVRSGIVVKGATLPLRVGTATLKSELPPEGRNVLVSGYPLDIPTFVTQKGMVASESFSVVEIPVPGAPAEFKRPETVDSILLDAVVNPGNSGGPVYDPNSGYVTGICVAYKFSPLFTNKQHQIQVAPDEALTQNSGLAVVIPIKYAIVLLRKNGVSDFSAALPRADHHR
jgi:S1-C subfamily serine protease